MKNRTISRNLFLCAAFTLLILAGSGSSTQAAFSFYFDNGTPTPTSGIFNPGDIANISVYMDFSAPPTDLQSVSWWMETDAPLGTFDLTIDSYASPFDQPAFSNSFTDQFTISQAGYYQNTNNLGGTNSVAPLSPQTGIFIGSVDFAISLTAAPGTYTIRSTTIGAPDASFAYDSVANPYDIAPATYTLIIVPEPSTYTMLMAGLLMSAYGLHIARRRRH